MTAVLFAVTTKTPPPPHTLNPNLPPALADLIVRLMHKDPAARPQSAAEVAAVVRQLVRDIQAQRTTTGSAVSLPVAAPNPFGDLTEIVPAARPAAPTPNRVPWIIGGALGVVALSAALVATFWRGTPPARPAADTKPTPKAVPTRRSRATINYRILSLNCL